MTTEIVALVEKIIQHGVFTILGAALVLSLFGAAFGAYIGSFLAEKGRNRAAEQDIEKLTKLVEQVKADIQARYTLRFAALDRRLQANQEAYGLSRKLVQAVQAREGVGKLFTEIGNWFDANCLYLETPSREALWDAYLAAHVLAIKERQHGTDSEEARAAWERIVTAQEKISAVLSLPSATSAPT